MKTSRNSLKSPFVLLAIVVICLAGAADVMAQGGFSGAIYTSFEDGATVNANQYPSKEDVYLNGGPQGMAPRGLPDGHYFYQVTNPSGSVLLSQDDADCRRLQVVGGVIAGSVAGDVCAGHPNGIFNPANQSTPVKLMPFADTPNNGGEYKVWLIRYATTTSISGADPKVIIFANSNAKTDNFKVRRTEVECIPGEDPECSFVNIGGMKYYDANGNGIKDPGEVPVAGVRILVTLSSPPFELVAITEADGLWVVENIPFDTDYHVEEILPPACEEGSYWVQTGPVADSNGFQGYEGTATGDVTDLDFGDICFSRGTGGMTLGFWSNKNGFATMSSLFGVNTGVYPTAVFPVEPGPGLPGDLYFLRRLNLKGEAMIKKKVETVDFDPTTHAEFKAWILAANAYNMSYMLSGQLAATSLNVRHSKFADSQIVDASSVCNSVGDCLGITTIGQVRRLANMSLGADGGNMTISGSPHRDSQELMKNFLDAVNNNLLSFASAEPCGVCYIDEQP